MSYSKYIRVSNIKLFVQWISGSELNVVYTSISVILHFFKPVGLFLNREGGTKISKGSFMKTLHT